MSRIIRYLLCLLSLFIVQQTARAQQFPVSASTQIIPPYSVYLPDYAVPGSDKLRVILVQNDLTRPSYDVRLQMTVERNGTVIMRTAPSFTPKPLTLSPGVPTIIGGTELYDYLNSVNIEFSGGFSRDEYERTKSLPEGAYRVSFTAYDYRRSQVQVSNVGANVFFFQKSDPPLLNLPICGSRVEKRDPQFMNFNWSTRNSPNPLPGSGTEYVFSLYEIKPAGSNPDYILRTARPIYTTTTESNTLVYGPGEPLLVDSMQYVWTVQARDKSGRDLFSNQGLSKSCTFTYLGNNPFAQFNIGKPTLSGRSNGQRSIRLSWPLAPADAAYKVEAYRLQYRATKKDGVEFDWLTEEKQKDTAFTVNSLEPGRSYEARLQWRVAGVYGAYSDLVTIKTDTLKPFVCGDATPVNQTTNTTPLVAAKITDIVRIGHFDVLLTQVSGGNGTFSGVGRVITPGFGIGLKMEFKNITINSDMLVTKGEMYAATEGIDKFVKDKLDEQRGGNDVGQVVTGDIVPDIKTNLYIFSAEDIKVDTTAKTITLTNSQSGQQEVINYKDKGKTLPLVLEDAGGNLYNIDKNGKVTSAGRRDSSLAGNAAALAALNTLQLDKGEVTFSVPSGSKYAFDAWKDSYAGKPVLDSSYELLANGKYRVSAKATQSGVQDVVIATLKNAAAGVADSLKFVSGKGIFYPFSRNGDTYTITITGGPAGDAQEVYAVFSKTGGGYTSIGKLLVASYPTLQKKVVLIPIGASTTVPVSAIESSLKSAYEKIGVVYTVEVDESFRSDLSWDDNGDKVLQDSKSAFLSNGFTGEEKAMKKAYRKSHDIDNNTVYLFVVNEAALSDGDLLGKMPRQSQFGFIFTKGASTDKVGRTVAHEIGHGDYTLEHTFSAGIGLPKATTENLMDYNSGYELLKYQWNIVHDPGSVWGIFEDDGESTLFYNNYFLIKDRLLKDVPDADYLDNDSINYVVPDGRIIRLGKDFKVSFGGYLVVKGTANASGMSKDAIGVITGFNKGDTYWSCLFSSDGTFLGYFSNGSTRTKYEFKEQTGERLIVAGVEFSKCQLAIYSGIYQAKAVKYTAFDEIPFKDNNRKLIGVKSIEGKECVECTLKLENKPADVQNVLKEYYVNPKSSRLDDLMENVSEQNMKNFLCVDERFELIRNISDGFVVGDDDEMSIIKLIRSTPDDQVKDMLSRFDKDSTGLLATIFSSIDGDELTEYFSAMSQLFIRSKSAIEWATIYNEFDLAAGKVQYSMDSRDCNFWYEMARQAKVFVTHAYNGEGVNTIHYTLPMEAPIYDQYGRVAASFRDNNCTLNILHQTFRTRPFELIRLLSYTKEGNIT
ncbi:MAG TPA: fibronectin type III domain-containing protein, partial [Chitinophaga sp.]|nr:fibronectin type III domain-containing protein [Chitinophaga sp.]